MRALLAGQFSLPRRTILPWPSKTQGEVGLAFTGTQMNEAEPRFAAAIAPKPRIPRSTCGLRTPCKIFRLLCVFLTASTALPPHTSLCQGLNAELWSLWNVKIDSLWVSGHTVFALTPPLELHVRFVFDKSIYWIAIRSKTFGTAGYEL